MGIYKGVKKMDINSCTIVGRITKDIELKTTQSGKKVVSFTIASNRDKENASFIDVVCWNVLAENLSRYCTKGNRIAVSGRLETRTYQNSDSKNVKVSEIIASNIQFLEYKTQEQQQFQQPAYQQPMYQQPMQQQYNQYQQPMNQNTYQEPQYQIHESDLPF